MDILAIGAVAILAAVFLAVWVRLRDRINELERRVGELRNDLYSSQFASRATEQAAPPQRESPPVPAPPLPAPEPEPKDAPEAPVTPSFIPPFAEPAAAPRGATTDWETRLGSNWLNKIGVFVLVVGIALALGYSFTQFGPLGRVSIGVAASFALLIAGAVFESREPYRNFARGLLGGGWAALYVTVYAMHAVPAARVIASPTGGAILLIVVAAGMIGHSLRYHAQTITGMAYFVAFGTLAITDSSSLPFLALIPLAGSLLFVAHRFQWPRLIALGLIATYGVIVLRGDTGAPLWQAQIIFTVYWLLFELFDILHYQPLVLWLNAAGAIGLSLMKWQTAAPGSVWMLLAAAAAAYLASALARIRSGTWQGPATLAAALTAATVFLRLDHQWVATALLVEAELVYLGGMRLRVPYLRWVGTALFGLEALRVCLYDPWALPAAQWSAIASLDAVVFYGNRLLCPADSFYGYAGAGMLALLIGRQARSPLRSVLWQAAACAAFAIGWWRRLFDFRVQTYLLFALGVLDAAVHPTVPPLAMAAAVAYAGVVCALASERYAWSPRESDTVRLSGSMVCAAALAAVLWRMVPGENLGLAWLLLSLPLLELGLKDLPAEFRRISYVVAASGALRTAALNVFPLWTALPAYVMAYRARREERGLVLAAASSAGLALALVTLGKKLPGEAVPAAWALAALALLWAANRSGERIFSYQSYATAALAFLACVSDLPDLSHRLWAPCLAIAAFYAAQLSAARAGHARLYFSLLATVLTTLLLFYRISGSVLTVACGMQGVILLISGFPLRERVLRLSGLVLLLGCILKLFVWDLRHLETFPRILSFIVLGVILLAVSWIYTRFREQVARFL